MSFPAGFSAHLPLPNVQDGHKLGFAWSVMTIDEREALAQHLFGYTPADWLADVLTRHGHSVSASTIRTYRRSLPPELRL